MCVTEGRDARTSCLLGRPAVPVQAHDHGVVVGVGHAVVVDCADVTFMDSMGLNALVEGLRVAEAAELGFELTGLSDPVLRVLELSGTTEMFVVRPREPVPEESES